MKYATLKVGSWRLTDLLKDPSGKEFDYILRSIETLTEEIVNKRKDLKADISPTDFEKLIRLGEEVYEKVSIVKGYANLKYYADTSSNEAAALVTKMEKMGSEIANRLLFLDLWFKRELDEENAQRLINSIPFVYREHFRHKRRVAKHALTEPEEKVINTLNVTGITALVKIYDKMTSGFHFTLTLKKGKRVARKIFKNSAKLVSLVRSPKAAERKAAYRALWDIYTKNSSVLGEIYQNIVIKWRDEGISMRGYQSPISVRNMANNLDDQTVDALLAVCQRNTPIFQRYFKLKAKMLGLKKLRRYDLYAPLSTKDSERKEFTFGRAISTMLETFDSFHPPFRKFAERMFEEEHVDSAIRDGKRGGAFCYSVTPKITPYVLLNFNGKIRDVSTLAHEFGHAMHSMAASDKPILVSEAPLPLAETASVFAENLLDEKLAEKVSSNERKLLMAEQIDEMYATIIRQAYFTLFEIEAHRAIGENGATIDDVSKIYLNNLREQFSTAVTISPDFQCEWLYIPHFYHSPFYCYAYSFGNLLVLSLYHQYKQEGKSAFLPKYLNILSAGGSRKPGELLIENGIDISKEEFWQSGFDYVANKVDVLKQL